MHLTINMKKFKPKTKSGDASLSHHLQGNLPRKGESKTQAVSEPSASADFCPEGRSLIVSNNTSGAASLSSPGGKQRVMLPGDNKFSNQQKILGGARAGYLETIENVLKKLSLPYVLDKPTPGDGNCFFHAVIAQMSRASVARFLPDRVKHIDSHLLLRKHVVQFMRDNDSFNSLESIKIMKVLLCEDFGKIGETPEAAWSRYLSEMSKQSCWAETLTIVGTAVFLQVNIHLVSKEQSKLHPWNKISCFHETNCPPLTIAYIPQEHFQSIIPKHEKHCCNDSGTYTLGKELSQTEKRVCQEQIQIYPCRKDKNQISYNSCKRQNNIQSIPKQLVQNNSRSITHPQYCTSCQGIFKSLKHHLSKSSKCALAYNMEMIKKISIEDREQYQKEYKQANRENLKLQHSVYNATNNTIQIEKHTLYNKNNREVIKKNKPCTTEKIRKEYRRNRTCITKKTKT